jgi:cytoskeleton protein RodZ
MDSQVGAILRRARNRRKVELSEVEATTRIRLRYLRAIEAEEWEVLPGGVYTRGFIRTYASFLGLDGDRLAADYQASVEGPLPETEPGPALPRPASPKPSRRPLLTWLLAGGAAILLAALVVVLLPSGGESPDSQRSGQSRGRNTARRKPQGTGQARPAGISVQLAASAEVWVCLLNAHGRPLVDGQILEAGAEVGPFRSGSFTVSFGNGEVSMTVDGSEAEIPATSSPVGYSIDGGGTMTQLSETERPTCA